MLLGKAVLVDLRRIRDRERGRWHAGVDSLRAGARWGVIWPLHAVAACCSAKPERC
jgi:hypothetical protein